MKLSIVIPTYNVEKYIEKTIKSLLAQTENEFEIIIVDDGSTDDTLKVLEAVLKENDLTKKDVLENIKLVKKDNGGVSSARNVGIEVASGKYIMFLDGDDYVAKDLVENIYENIKNRENDDKGIDEDIICWGCNIVDEQGVTIQNYFDKFTSKQKDMTGIEALNNMVNYKTMWIYTGSAVYRKGLLEENKIKYVDGCANGEDQEFTIKALARSKQVLFIDKILSYYVMRGTSISNSYNIKRFDAIFAMERTYKYIENIQIDNMKNYELQNDDLRNRDLNKNTLKIIYTKIKTEHIVDNYIYNFDCCLASYYKDGMFNRDSFKKLYDDIGIDYPTLNREVVSIMKDYSGKNIKILFKVKMFLSSPAMYTWVFNLKNKIK